MNVKVDDTSAKEMILRIIQLLALADLPRRSLSAYVRVAYPAPRVRTDVIFAISKRNKYLFLQKALK